MVSSEEIENIRQQLESLLNCSRITEESSDPDYLYFCHSQYDTKSRFNFLQLMRIAKIFGTLDFDLIEEFVIGEEYSECTKDPDQMIKAYKVARNKINSGLPPNFLL